MFLSWAPEDIDKAMAYELAQREACPHDGSRVEDWYYRDEDGDLIPHDPPHLEPVQHVCEGCAATKRLRLHLEAQAVTDAGDGPDANRMAQVALAGVYVTLEPFDPNRTMPGG